jgi:uroporphyrinogen-III synthase
MLLPVIITRPSVQDRQWREALQLRLNGARTCHALPLIAIETMADPLLQLRLQRCWQELALFHAAVFVSPTAVESFFATAPAATATWQEKGLRAWAVGPGTRHALLQAGVAPECIDSPDDSAAQFESETLWPLVQPQLAHCLRSGKKILRVRGTDRPATPIPPSGTADEALSGGTGRDWLGAAIRRAGIELESVATYRRQLPAWNDEQAQTARSLASTPAVWLFSSSLALRNLAHLFPGASWMAAVALATHPRIAGQAHRLGFGQVVACRPTPDDVVQSLQSCP